MARKSCGLLDWAQVPDGSLAAYALATALVAFGAAVEWGLNLAADGIDAFGAFLPAVLFATIVGGGGPGSFAVVLGLLIGWWAFLPPPRTFAITGLAEQITLIVYVVVALTLVYAGEHCRRASRKAARQK